MSGRSGGRYITLLRTNPDLRRLYLSRLVSFGGDWFLLVPMLGLVNELSGSSVLTAAVLAANTLPAFPASPLGGVMADRFDRRRIMMGANLAAAAAATGMLLVDHPAVLRAGAGVPLALTGLAILAALYIAPPLLLPIAVALGMNPLHYAVLIFIAVQIGTFCPPLGVGYYIAAGVTNTGIEEGMPATLAYLGIIVLGLCVLALFPILTLVVPRLFGLVAT